MGIISKPVDKVNHRGATAADWQHWQALGLEADLLPVVCDLEVPVHPASKVRLDGKTPSRTDANGLAAGLPGWPKRRTTAAEVARWAKDHRHGIGLIGRQVKAFDIDIDDEVTAGAVRDMLELTLGALPCRGRPGTGKKLLAFRLAEPMPKRIIKTAHGAIELLGDRQQFLLVGQHKSGTRYAWEGGLPAEIPTLTLAEVDAAWQALAETFGVADATERTPYAMRAPVHVDGEDRERNLVVEHWEGLHGEDPQGRIEGRCPWEVEHSPGGAEFAMYFPAAVKGQGHSGFKCLHAHCSERTVFDFLRAIGVEAEKTLDEFEVIAPQTVAQADGAVVEVQPLPAMTRMKNGKVEATRNNLTAALRRPDLCGILLRYDRFAANVMFAPVDRPDEWRVFSESSRTDLCRHLESGTAGFTFVHVPTLLAAEIVSNFAEHNQFDSAQTWLESLAWDGVPRVDSFLARHLRAEDGEYARAVSRYLLTALAGRVLEPGVKADMVPVFVGRQGAGKSSVVAALAPSSDHFLELDLSKAEDDRLREMAGRLVLELGELRGLRAREHEELKQFISRRVDSWIPKYKEGARNYPRRSVFIGTSNTPEFLSDETGNRRWLPIEVAGHETPEAVGVAVAAVAAERDQLWAEAAALFRLGGVAWCDAEALAKPEHARFEIVEPWAAAIGQWLEADAMDGTDGPKRGDAPFTTEQVLLGAVHVELRSINDAQRKRVAAVLRRMGYADRRSKVGGLRSTFWARP